MNKPATSSARNASRVAVALLLLLVTGGGLWFWQRHQAAAAADGYRTAMVERGDIRVAISATGTLGAISTVDVGSQISGQVTSVLVDFNDHVGKGQVLARIDPSTYQAQIAQGSAAVGSARANLASMQATLRNAEADYARKSNLARQQLVARSDADLARAARDQARAQVGAAQAQITQQQASTETAQLNLQRTVIRSPVDGVVLTRTIEPGQTVAASLQAPVLFQIAEDLSKMEIVLAIDEADIGQVKAGQKVSFSVDAFPDRQYGGTVEQVRLSPTNTSNVITYPVVVAVDNTGRRLLPGMTANAEIEISRKADVLRVPNAALRYKPDDDAQDGTSPSATAGGAGVAEDLPRLAKALRLNPGQQSAFDAALTAMRERAAARRRTPVAATTSVGAGLFGGRGGQRPANGNSVNQGAMRQRVLQRTSQQFAAFRATLDAAQQQQWDSGIAALASARRAPLYLLVDGQPNQVLVRVGASDGTSTEVSGNIRVGDKVIVGAGRSTAAP